MRRNTGSHRLHKAGFFISFCVLLIFFLTPHQLFPAEKLKEELARKWELVSIGQESVSGFLLLDKLKKEQPFTFVTASDTLTGTWEASGDSLLLYPDLQPVTTALDSISYTVENGEPRVDLFFRGERITTITRNGLEADSVSLLFLVKSLSEKELQLVGVDSGQEYNFTYISPIQEGGFSFQSLMRGFLGMIALLFITWLLSANKRAIDWRLVGIGMGLQVIFALLVLKVPMVSFLFEAVASFFVKVLDFSYAGSVFLFGDLVSRTDTFGYIFAFQVLPTIVFFSALSSLLYYVGIMQKIVYGFAWVMSKTMRLSGAESLAAASNIFIGQTEAPLVVKPYLEKMTKSEILCLMVGGMATIAGGVFAAYVGFLGGTDPVQRQYFATHLLTASILSAPAAIVAAKMLFPETEPDKIDREINIPKTKIGSNLLDAISNGTTDGLRLAVNVGAMLLTFTALIYMFNYLLGLVGGVMNLNESIKAATDGRFDGLSLDYLLGVSFSPVAWLLGTPWSDSMLVGELLGKKTIINEFVAYEKMNAVKDAGLFLHQKSVIIATYALCGFANFASIGIQIGGIGALAPNQRKTLARFGIKALIGGTVASFLTAVIAGVIVG